MEHACCLGFGSRIKRATRPCMENNMELRVDMLQEEAQMTQYKVERARDRRLRRLQWAVTGCSISLFALLCLTLYQMFGNIISPKPDQMERCPQTAGALPNPEEKPRAHLTGTSQSTAKTKDQILQWEGSNGLAFVGGGMRFENKSIHIPKEGFYFVYSQVSLKIPSNFEEHFESQVLRVNNNYGDPEVLFSGKAVKNGQQTIYLAGLLHLIKGDRLKVNVTAVDQVDIRSSDKTFFGAFWVMDKPTR